MTRHIFCEYCKTELIEDEPQYHLPEVDGDGEVHVCKQCFEEADDVAMCHGCAEYFMKSDMILDPEECEWFCKECHAEGKNLGTFSKQEDSVDFMGIGSKLRWSISAKKHEYTPEELAEIQKKDRHE